MQFRYTVETSPREIAAGDLDRLADEWMENAAEGLAALPSKALVETLRKANRAVGEYASFMPRDVKVSVEFSGEAVVGHGSGETLVVRLAAFQPVEPQTPPREPWPRPGSQRALHQARQRLVTEQPQDHEPPPQHVVVEAPQPEGP